MNEKQGVDRLRAWAPESWPVAADWQPVVAGFMASPTGQRLGQFIQARLAAGQVIYPPTPLLALSLTALQQVRVVILGQDPYHGLGQAQGLAFSVAPGVPKPPSLCNIFKEIACDPQLNQPLVPNNGSLIRWANQGVLLLNTCLTVAAGQPNSHAQQGWETLTDLIVRQVAAQPGPVAFLLWGSHAQAKRHLIRQEARPAASVPHLVLQANHPSPLSALRGPLPFIGCGHFSWVNAYLRQYASAPIAW
jgi:uracil-DNA glycosylase